MLEKPPVDRIAAAAIAKRGVSDRVSVIAQDMLADPLPGFADVHLFSNVLHDWDVPVVTGLLDKSFTALPPGGLVVVHDAFLNAAKTGPLHVAEYSVLLMHASEGRCYSTAEMEGYLGGAGFVDPHYIEGRGRARDHDGAQSERYQFPVSNLQFPGSSFQSPSPKRPSNLETGVRGIWSLKLISELPHETDPEPHLALAAVAGAGVQAQVRGCY